MNRQITHNQFYKGGGFANPRTFRKANSVGAWTYWELA
jgi:hypothetical protein